MEMALGLTLGLVLGGGVRRDQVGLPGGFFRLDRIGSFRIQRRTDRDAGGNYRRSVSCNWIFAESSRSSEQRGGIIECNACSKSSPVRIGLFLVLVFGVVFGTLYLGGEHLASRIEASRTEFYGGTTELVKA